MASTISTRLSEATDWKIKQTVPGLTFILTTVSKMDTSLSAHDRLNTLGSRLRILAHSHSEVDTTPTATTSHQIPCLRNSMVVHEDSTDKSADRK